jgi:hypothetical protein
MSPTEEIRSLTASRASGASMHTKSALGYFVIRLKPMFALLLCVFTAMNDAAALSARTEDSASRPWPKSVTQRHPHCLRPGR